MTSIKYSVYAIADK